MAMNGFYTSKSDEKNDVSQMKQMVSDYNLGNRSLTRKERDSICPRVVIKLNLIDDEITQGSLNDGKHKDFAIELEQQLSQLSLDSTPAELSAYGFIVVDFRTIYGVSISMQINHLSFLILKEI